MVVDNRVNVVLENGLKLGTFYAVGLCGKDELDILLSLIFTKSVIGDVS